MEHLCLRDEDLAAAAELPADSPARRQWSACPRCRARVAAFAEFLHPSIEAKGQPWDDADARLAAALESEIRGMPLGAKVPAGSPDAPAGARAVPGQRPRSQGRGTDRPGPGEGPIHRLSRWLVSPSLRPVAALAVLVVALGAIGGIRLLGHRSSDAIILREGSTPASSTLALGDVSRTPDGGVSLSWDLVEGADRYEVVLCGEDLVEMKRFDAGGSSSFVIPAEESAALTGIPRADGPDPSGSPGTGASSGATGSDGPMPPSASQGSEDAGALLFWRVIASREGDTIAQSRIRPLRPPAR